MANKSLIIIIYTILTIYLININGQHQSIIDITKNITTTISPILVNDYISINHEPISVVKNDDTFTTNQNQQPLTTNTTTIRNNNLFDGDVNKLVNNLLNKTESNELPENFDFNLDDLEDLHEELQEKKRGVQLFDDDVDDDDEDIVNNGGGVTENNNKETTTFKEFSLDEDVDVTINKDESTKNPMTSSTSPSADDDDSKNIYRVTKNKNLKSKVTVKTTSPQSLIPPTTSSISPSTTLVTTSLKPPPLASSINGSIFHSYSVMKDLYEQSHWNINDIKVVVGHECGNAMELFLMALDKEIPWAMRVNDQSGKYRGQLFYGNELWVGSIKNCEEINYQRSLANDDVKLNQPQMEFYAAHLFISTPVKPNSRLQLGQCLPKVCSLSEISEILRLDTAANELISQSPSNVTLLNIRTVPGDYKLWTDYRFRLLLGIFIVTGIFTFISTVYELTFARKYQENNRNNQNSTTISTGIVSTISTTAVPFHHVTIHHQNGKKHQGHINGGLEIHEIHKVENNNLGGCDMELEVVKSIKHNMNQSTNRNNNNNNINNNNNNNNNNNEDDDEGDDEEQYANNGTDTGLFPQLLLCFGFISNTRAILSSKKLKDESVSCIHGMRVFSLLWTIMVHTFLQTFGISENKFSRTIIERNFWYQMIGNATYAVDTFFFLSGLLVTLLFLRGDEKANARAKHPRKTTLVNGTKKTVLLMIYRYLRLTPAYFTALLCSEISLKYIYNKSVFEPGLTDHTVCPEFWWRNMLYIQNWYPFSQLCMIWSWFLANEVQFYLWAIIILIFSRRFFKTSIVVVMAFLLASWTISVMISLKLNYKVRISEPLETFGYLYDRVWTRIGPYIMGMIAGYFLFRYKEPPKISRLFNLSMWALSFIIMFFVIFGIWDGILDVPRSAIYISFSHTGWGFALIWITLSCKWGYAENINAFLSYKGFLPLSRLTYCTYLIHPITQIVTAFQMQGPFHLQYVMVMTIFLGNAIVSYFCAFILSLLCEAPILRMLRVFFRKF